MNEKIYDISFKRLVVWLFPKPIRKPVQTAWVMALLTPLLWLDNQFQAFRTSVLYYLSITPQVCRLEKLLNDRYDAIERRIRIVDGQEFEPVFLFRKDESKPAWLHRKSEEKPVFFFTKAETGTFSVDFVVQVSVFVVYDLNEMRGLIKRFKLASKTFKIQTL